MSKITKVISALTLTTIMGTTLTACGSSTESTVGVSDTIVVDFWTAPQIVQYNYWTSKAEAFNATNTEIDGKVVKVEVQQMPESPSSEAGIQNAIATGSAPAISENINRGFATTLAQSDVIYSLGEEQWFKDIVENKQLDTVMPGWEINGEQYVLPQYVNPMVLQWNVKALKELGFDKAPETLDEFKSVITKFRESSDKMKELGVSHVFYRNSLLRPDQWWDRWSDFQNIYLAFSGGKPWVEGDSLVLDAGITKEAFEFFGMMGDTLLTQEISTVWPEEKIPVLCTIASPWDIQSLRDAGKTYGYDGDYVYGPMIVKNAGDTAYNYADSKGLVLYKSDNITEEMHNGAVEFVKYVYSDENSAKTDLEWLEATKMLPVRGDLTTNEEFAAYLSENPELADLAVHVPYAVPCMPHDKMTPIQEALGNSLSSYIQTAQGIKDFNVPDATSFVEKAFEDMKQAGGLK